MSDAIVLTGQERRALLDAITVWELDGSRRFFYNSPEHFGEAARATQSAKDKLERTEQ
jgi:hypothetical protein